MKTRTGRSTSRLTVAVLLVTLAAPGIARAHPCEEEIAKAAQDLDLENRNLLLLEMQGSNPTVRLLRADFDRRFLLFISLRDQCAANVRAEKSGSGAPAPSGCTKDTDCKGDRICVSGSCVNP